MQIETLSIPGMGGVGEVKAEFWVGASHGVVQLINPSQPASPAVFPVGELKTNVKQPLVLDVLPIIDNPSRSSPK
jgi:hypothetical protein